MRTHLHSPRSQRGVAALVVVMVLFLVVSLVAAYASRNLLFEQRTSANQYRSTQALAAAEAGMDWALAQLNGGLIDSNCDVKGTLTNSFRDRYLAFSSGGQITARGPIPPGKGTYLYPTCVLDGTTWSCSCPSTTNPSLNVPTSPGSHPAFRVYFRTLPQQQARVVQVFVNGCTKLDPSCLQFNPAVGTTAPPSSAIGSTNEGIATVSAVFALTGGITSPPVNALAAHGNVNLGGAAIQVNIAVAGPVFPNYRPLPSPYVIHAGGTVNTMGLVLQSTGGTPSSQAVLASDTTLANLNADGMFAATFNMARSTFETQPAMIPLACTNGPCKAIDLQTAIASNPGRPLWVQGDLFVDPATTLGDIGSAAAPVLIKVDGNVDFGAWATGTAPTLYGVLYVQTTSWTMQGSAQVRGAVIAEGDIIGSGTPNISYDSNIIKTLRSNTGSFVIVPGSWQDF